MPRRANRTRTGGATTRCQLSLAPTTLASLKKAIETACNVPAARAARMTRGRAAAAALLKGIRTRVVDAKAESVKISVVRYAGRPPLDLVPLPRLLPRPLPRRQPPALRFSQQRAVNLSPPSTALTGGPLAKKKRPSGRSNWPKTKADRDAWMARRAARAARGEPVGRAALVAARRQNANSPSKGSQPGAADSSTVQACRRAVPSPTELASEDVAAYVPSSPEEHAAFRALLSSVAHAAGVEEGQVVAPTCQVSMSADPRADSQAWSRRLRSGMRARAHAFVAVQAQTPARRVRVRSALEETGVGGTPPAPLSAGEALYVPVVSGSSAGVWTCPGEGDFVLELAVSIV